MLFSNEFHTVHDLQSVRQDILQSSEVTMQSKDAGKGKWKKSKKNARRQQQTTDRHEPLVDSMNATRLSSRETEEALEKPFAPDYIYDVLRSKKKFGTLRGSQEDAEEFLTAMLDCLHEEFAAAITGTRNLLASKDEGWIEKGAKQRNTAMRTVGEEANSPIRDIFGGVIRSVVRRYATTSNSSNHDSATLEPFYSLHLDISIPNIRSVEDAMTWMARAEEMEDKSLKKIFIEKWPPVLILHLKRFVYDPELGVRKVRRPVAYGHTMKIQSGWTYNVGPNSALRFHGKSQASVVSEYRLVSGKILVNSSYLTLCSYLSSRVECYGWPLYMRCTNASWCSSLWTLVSSLVSHGRCEP